MLAVDGAIAKHQLVQEHIASIEMHRVSSEALLMKAAEAKDAAQAEPANAEQATKAREDLVEGYELFREFDRSTFALIEPLRAMRIIYVSGWIAKRWDDPSFPHAYPNFKDVRYWMQEYEALAEIAEILT